jgi:AcrR family transcriptional regulator
MSLADGPPPMNRPVRHRSTRDRPAKAPLSEDAVVDAALAILKSEGLEAVTMRRVAHALDTGAASLYVYVSGREGLHQALVAHPGIAAMTLAEPPTTEAVLLLTETLLGILLVGGLDRQDAAWACDIFVLLVTAAAREDDVRRPRGRSDDGGRQEHVDKLYKTFAGLPPDRFPLIAAHASSSLEKSRAWTTARLSSSSLS